MDALADPMTQSLFVREALTLATDRTLEFFRPDLRGVLVYFVMLLLGGGLLVITRGREVAERHAVETLVTALIPAGILVGLVWLACLVSSPYMVYTMELGANNATASSLLADRAEEAAMFKAAADLYRERDKVDVQIRTAPPDSPGIPPGANVSMLHLTRMEIDHRIRRVLESRESYRALLAEGRGNAAVGKPPEREGR